MATEYGSRRRFGMAAILAMAAVALAADGQDILLRAGRLDTGAAGAPGWRAAARSPLSASVFSASEQDAAQGGRRVFLLQVDGPLTGADRGELERAGARIVAFIPRHACLVAVDADAFTRLTSLVRLRWVGEWLPAYKLEPELLAAFASSGPEEMHAVTVQVLSAADAVEVAAVVRKEGGEVLAAEAAAPGIGVVRARLTPAAAHGLSRLAAVLWVERYVAPVLCNDLAATGPRMNVTNLWATYGLTGSNQVVGHCDTGLDIGSYTGIHPDFEGRIRYAVGLAKGPLGRGGAWSDPDGHGTHTAGSILGSGAASGGQYRGIAYQAQLVHQSVIDKLGLLTGLPLDLNTLFLEAYTNGARVHSDSWGSSVAGRYDTSAQQCDEFMWTHPEMLLVFAASNDGADGDTNGVVDFDSLGSPGTAKNVLCVGAAESGRAPGSGGYSAYTYGEAWPSDYPLAPVSNDYISASPPGEGQGLAAFSSRGPADDGRIKPDVVSPGTDIISCRSRHPKAGLAWGAVPGNSNYIFSGGTSMATPLTAGAAALVRQFYVQQRGMTNPGPSAALLKATMMNGARSLTPGQYGAGAGREIPPPPRPNAMEGWGHVDIEDSLFPRAPRVLSTADGESVGTGETNAYVVTVTAGGEPFTATLAYSDYPGFAASARALVNDLDLRVVDPTNGIHHPFGLEGSDPVNNAETVEFLAGAGTYRVEVVGRDVPAGSQPYALVLTAAGTLATTGQSLSLVAATGTVSEAAGWVEAIVRRTGGQTGTVGVDLETAAATAVSPDDFGAVSTTLVFTASVRERAVRIPVVDDALDEDNELFVVRLRNAQGGASLGAITQAVVEVADNDGPGRLQFASASYDGMEGGAAVAVTVSRVNGSIGTVSVGYATSNGTATGGADYVPAAGTLVFTNGVTDAQFTVPILDDTDPEGLETVLLGLASPTGGADLGARTNAVLAIGASDQTNVVLQANFDSGLPEGWSVIANGDPSAVWRFDDPGTRGNLTGGSNGFAIADSDFAGAVNMDTELRTPALDLSALRTVTVSFKADFRWWSRGGDEQASLRISTNGAAGPWDPVFTIGGASQRGPRTLSVDLTSRAAGMPNVRLAFCYFQASGDWWLELDDVKLSGEISGPAGQHVRCDAADVVVGESDAQAVVPVVRTGGTAGAASVRYATVDGTARAGADFVASTGVVTFADGVATAAVQVALLGDGLSEDEESFALVLSDPQGAMTLVEPSQCVVRVRDDDVVILPRLAESFSGGGLPAGWSVVANGATQAVWRFDDPGGRTNLTGGAGGFAIADSAYYMGTNMDTELRTPTLNCAPYDTVELRFRQDFNWYLFNENEVADVDVSRNGAEGPWVNAARLTGTSWRGPAVTNIALGPLAGRTNVMIRFHYHQAVSELWWQVDDVTVDGAVTGGNRDTDQDGLPDWWEGWNFGGVTNGDGDADSDGDRMRDGDEYIAGTDPLDAQDQLHVDRITMGTNATLRFDTVSGRVYRVHTTTNLAEGWVPGPTHASDGGVLDVGERAAGPRDYYRLEVIPPPAP